MRLDHPAVTATELAERLLRQGIAIRTFSEAQHLDGRFSRVAVRTAAENGRLCDALAAALGVSRPAPKKPHRAKALMIQGTSSNAGKSVLTAALCRILLQDGVRVAPFKAQNMSFNSFVARGGEMGRAQVVQAQACRLEPDVRMNPVLLKPNSDTGCQVIVRGHPVGNMRVGEYVAYKPRAFAAAKTCYDALAAEFDAIVLEGAGSPGEVNLKSHDIVNMRMAEYAAAPVLVVGDIDRGGVFASFVGTMEVLAPWERKLLAGWIVNRFRGDAGLLGPALEYTHEHTGRPVLGVVPYLADLGLPQEDSVEFKSGALDRTAGNGAGNGTAVEIAVIDLPHISNFTDFDAFQSEGDVRLRIVRSAADLDRPDAVIIPGSKNTLGDLEYLGRSGLAERITALARQGAAEIVGICGGLQMLGREIRDPLADRVGGGELPRPGTARRQHGDGGRENAGSAPPPGTSPPAWKSPATKSITVRRTMPAAGRYWFAPTARWWASPATTSAIWGTYLHGVFDADAFRRWFVDRLRVRRGLPAVGTVDRPLRHRAGPGSPGRSGPRERADRRDLSAHGIAMRLEYQILIAVAIDLLLGDPPWLPHPVRGIGRLALAAGDAAAPHAGGHADGRPGGRAGDVCAGRRGRLGSDSPGGRRASAGRRRGVDPGDLHDHRRPRFGPAQHGRLASAGGRRPGRSPATRRRDRRPRYRSARRGRRDPGGRGKRGRKHR